MKLIVRALYFHCRGVTTHSLFGISFDISGLSESLVSIVGTVFGILAVIGIIIDPTTEGISDSARAMTYDEPNKDK